MVYQLDPLKRMLCLLLFVCSFLFSSAQWHKYAIPDTFQVAAGVPTVLDVLDNDDLVASPNVNNYIPNPITVDYPFPFGTLQSENGGTLVILNNDSIQYTPPNGFSGNDRFYYGIGDASNPNFARDTAKVLLTVGTVTQLDQEIEGGVSVFPNPTSKWLLIQGLRAETAFDVYGMDGKWLLTGEGKANVAMLPPGVYVVRIHMENGPLHRRFVKE